MATLGEAAKSAGWRVGYVTTTRITHATPACFYAHHPDRYDEAAVAEQLVASNVDLAVGGGHTFFLPAEEGGVRRDGRNLIDEARAKGWKLLGRAEPRSSNWTGRLLGLFANDHLGYELDDRNYPPVVECDDRGELRVAEIGLLQQRAGQPDPIQPGMKQRAPSRAPSTTGQFP